MNRLSLSLGKTGVSRKPLRTKKRSGGKFYKGAFNLKKKGDRFEKGDLKGGGAEKNIAISAVEEG